MSGIIRKTLIAGGFVVAVVAVATGTETVFSAQASENSDGSAVATAALPSAAAAQTEGHDVARELSQAFRNAAGQASPAVVYVEVQVRQQATANQFRIPFGNPQERAPEQRAIGSGTGFIFRADGYILTNNHVVEDAEKVHVRLQDGRQFSATVQGRDPVTDVAVLKVDATDLPTVQLGDSDEIDVGDWVVALGFPLNISTTSSTATAGIVSAKGRSIGILNSNNPDAPPLEQFIQTDAAINRGNSGGPLIDLHGRVIGINSAIASQTGFYAGYGFAIPSNIVRRVADDLVQYGEFRRPRLGVEIATPDQADMEVYHLESLEGAEIVSVQDGLAAAKAGIEAGDVVVALDGHKIIEGGQLTEMLTQYRPGDRVDLDVVRYGKKLQITAELGNFDSGARVARAEPAPEARETSVLGFRATELNAVLARQLQVDDPEGVVITEVDRFGPAARSLQPGLLVERVNGREIRSLADLQNSAKTIKPGTVVSIIARVPGDGRRQILNYRVES